MTNLCLLCPSPGYKHLRHPRLDIVNSNLIMSVIAVAGGTGGVGKTIVEVLAKQPTYQVIVLTRHVGAVRESHRDNRS